MAEIVRSTNNVVPVKDERTGVVLGYQEFPAIPEPVLHVGEGNTLTPNAAGSRWVIAGADRAVYICACGCTTEFPVGAFTKFPLKAKCCINALPLERN